MDCAINLSIQLESDILLKKWAKFIRRKIETWHRLRESYSACGKMNSQKDAGSYAYCYASYIFACFMDSSSKMPDKLKWLNALLKCNDILIFLSKPNELSSFPSLCAKEAIYKELSEIKHLTTKFNIKW